MIYDKYGQDYTEYDEDLKAFYLDYKQLEPGEREGGCGSKK